jgi:hypothetical protein
MIHKCNADRFVWASEARGLVNHYERANGAAV